MEPKNSPPLPLTDQVRFLALHSLINTFKKKVDIYFEKGPFIVQTIGDPQKLNEVLQLRHEVFHVEFLNRTLPFGVDFDMYDQYGDHLVILHKESAKIVGTYRMMSSLYSQHFYSESEFNIKNFLQEPGNKLELSRACVHKDFRNGTVFSLLWRGLRHYMTLTNSDYFFGCASLRTMDPVEIIEIYKQLQAKNFYSHQWSITAKKAYHLLGFEMPESTKEIQGNIENPKGNPDDVVLLKDRIPHLLRYYFKAGAKVHGYPCLDRDFQCIDLFTVLCVKDLSFAHVQRYYK